MAEDTTPLRVDFNGSLRIEGRPERLTSEAGAIVLREVLERVGIVPWLGERLIDPRKPELITHPLSELMRTSLLLLAQGWRDQDDADALRDDAALRLAVSDRRGTAPLETRKSRDDGEPLSKNPLSPDGLASQPTLSRFVAMLSTTHNRSGLRLGLLEIAARRLRAERDGHRRRYLTIDLDSLPIEVHGHQPGSEYNGHYHGQIYHPLIASVADTGDLLDVQLREGAVHTAAGGIDFLLPLLDDVERELCQVAAVRIDAGFPEENFLGALEGRGTPYVARVKNNAVLNRMAEPFLKRPVGRPPLEPRMWFHEHMYQAKSWSRPRRVILVTIEHPGQLFLDHFWLITNWSTTQMDGPALLEMYRKRGTAEGHMGELMDVLRPALSSSPRPKSHYRGAKLPPHASPIDAFAHNEVILLLNALAYNIAHAGRVLMETATTEGWSLRRFRERVLRVAARVVVHSRQATLILSTETTKLWHMLWPQLDMLQVAPAS
ncbi:MAG: IS1380 family transposase [Minicystis sp.]